MPLIDLNGLGYFKGKENAMVAGNYSASNTYAVGDYVYYSGTLYRCTTAITTAEAWTAAHWTAAKLAEDLTSQSENFNDLYSSNIPITVGTMENGKFINTNGERVTDSLSSCTGLVTVRPNSNIKIKNCYLVGNRSICAYDETGDFVSCLIYNSQNTEVVVSVPSNAYNIKVTSAANVTPTLEYVSIELAALKTLEENIYWRVTEIPRPIRTDGKYVRYDTGNLVTDADSGYSDYIAVNPGSRIRVAACYIVGNRSICAYDHEKHYIGALAYASTDTVKELDIPDNAFYIRVTTKAGMSAYVSYLTLELDAIGQLYKAIRVGNVQLAATMTSGKYVSGASASLGNLVTDADSAYSDFIAVEPNSIISVYGCYLVGNRAICCYDGNRTAISALSPSASQNRSCVIEIPSNARYIRITGLASEDVYLCYDSAVLSSVSSLSKKVDDFALDVDALNMRIDNLNLENVEVVIEKLNEISTADIANVSEFLTQVTSLKKLVDADNIGYDKECVVTFLNDDGSTGQYYDLYPIMSELNCPYSQCIYTNQYDIQTVEMMQNVIALGGDIGSHSVTHAHLMNLTEAELIIELRDSKEYFTSRGIPCDYIVYPHGESNDLVRMVAKRYYDFGVSAEDRYNEYPIEDWAIKRQTLGSYLTPGHDTYEYYKSLVDHAILNKQWLVFMLHSNYVEFDATQKQHLRDIIAYIRSQNVRILSMTNAYKIFGNTIKIGDNSTGTSGRASNLKNFVISKWGDFSTNIFTWSPPSN